MGRYSTKDKIRVSGLWQVNELYKVPLSKTNYKELIFLIKEYNNYAFIDGENLYKSIRKQGWKLDYYKFRKYLSDKYNITKALIFIGYVNWNKALYNYLRKASFELVFKQTITKPNGEPKGNVDAELVLRVMLETENFDKAIIVTCDGDYSCLVRYLTTKKKLLNLMIPDRRRYSALLRQFRKYIVYMNELKVKLEYKKR
ncbi:hypothetical protein ES702_04882 [subsurface metagenome]